MYVDWVGNVSGVPDFCLKQTILFICERGIAEEMKIEERETCDSMPAISTHQVKAAFREAGRAFLLSRGLILVVSILGSLLIPLFNAGSVANCTRGIQASSCVLMWYHWDAIIYTGIAYGGYGFFAPSVAFYPLWPLLMHFGGLLLGGVYPLSYYLAGLLLANFCFFFALVLFYCLLVEDFGPAQARRALFYLALYPYVLYFFVGYSEALFLLLCLAVFLLLRRGRALDWWLAGLLGFLASLTRSTGLVLSVPFFVVYIQRFWLPSRRAQSSFRQKLNAFVPILLIPAGILVYMVYLGYVKGNPLIAESFEWTYWHRHFTPIWDSFLPVLKSLMKGPFFSFGSVRDGIDLLFTLLPIVALFLGWKRLPLHYSLFALSVMLFSLSFSLDTTDSLTSQPRYMASAFPIIVVFALWGEHRRFNRVYLALAGAVLLAYTLMFINHIWIA